MRTLVSAMALFGVLSTCGCDLPGILSSEEDGTLRHPFLRRGDIILNVEITGGIAGIYNHLAVDEFGLASFSENPESGEVRFVMLDSAELDSLKQTLLDNGFFKLDSLYIDEQVADAFFYQITFSHENRRKTVTTDYFGAPGNLRQIVSAIDSLRQTIVARAPGLELRLSAAEISRGEQVKLELVLSNPHSEALTLGFGSSQVYDFFVEKAGDRTGERLVWNWAHDKMFTLATWQMTLQPGERRLYEVTWDGRDNSGRVVVGDFRVGALLVSTPGGSPAARPLRILP